MFCNLGIALPYLAIVTLFFAVAANPANAGQYVLQSQQAHSPARQLHGRFLHITDMHPDEFFRVHSSTEEGIACHRGKGIAGLYGAETSDCDSPISLINATFDWIAANLKDRIDFVIWTGDSARHDSDEAIPRSLAQVLGTNRLIVDKFLGVFADQDGTRQLSIPIIPTLGNNDILPHNILLPGPNKWLQYYNDIWHPFIPEEQRHSFGFGGWFQVEVVPDKLAVFSLNTLYFFDRNAGVDDCAQPSEPGFKQMEWLRVQLSLARRRGMKAILMGHIPPARTSSKRLWDETCWQKYNLWLRQYRDVIVGSVYGHMNVDHFLIHDTKDVDIQLVEDQGEPDVEFSVQTTAEYLQELRDGWSRLPKPNGQADTRPWEASRSHVKKPAPAKELGRRWAERYHVSLINPSVVPNYFPTLRVIEYNTSGLEGIRLWQDSVSTRASSEDPDNLQSQLKRETEIAQKRKNKDTNGRKGGKNKPKKPKKPKDPNIIVPEPPAPSSPPGPAYSQQAFTVTGYTQYYANLTRINNDMTHHEQGVILSNRRWEGVYRGKKRNHDKPHALPFSFEVEYSTFNDTVYKLDDLTVKSYLQLAYRMALSDSGKKAANALEDDTDIVEAEATAHVHWDDEFEDAEDADAETDVGLDSRSNGGHDKKRKNKKKKKVKKKHNKVWLHFLKYAFVSTVEEDQLKEL